MSFTPSAADRAFRTAATARRKALEAQYRAERQAATGPACTCCGAKSSMILPAFQAGRISGCCSGTVALPVA